MTHTKSLLLAGITVASITGAIAVMQHRESYSGYARVIDGDTLELRYTGQRIRLAGIDAPEARQPCADNSDCGLRATVHLITLIGGHRVTCTIQSLTDPYGRILADCYAADPTTSLNAAMILDGYAVDYSHFSHNRYAEHERTARTQNRGLWAHGGFDTPSSYRQMHRYDNASPIKKVQN